VPRLVALASPPAPVAFAASRETTGRRPRPCVTQHPSTSQTPLDGAEVFTAPVVAPTLTVWIQVVQDAAAADLLIEHPDQALGVVLTYGGA
jgi:hypothetical protein